MMFSTTANVSGDKDIKKPDKITSELLSNGNSLITNSLASWKRPKLEVRRAEASNSQVEKSPLETTLVEPVSPVFTNNVIVPPKVVLMSQRTPEVTSLGNMVDRRDGVITEKLNANFDFEDVIENGEVDTRSSASKLRSRQCIAFIKSKRRRCVRWANGGDEFCCIHLSSRAPANSAFNRDGVKYSSSSENHLKRKHDDLSETSEVTSCKDVVIFGEAKQSQEKHFAEVQGKSIDRAFCVGLGLEERGAICPDNPNRHSLYCEKHLPIWLKRARNGKSRIISKEVFLDLLRESESQMQKIYLHQACEIYYKLFKNILSSRNQVPKEKQLEWALLEASKDLHVEGLLIKLVSKEKERLQMMWGVEIYNNEQVSSVNNDAKSLVPVVENANIDGSFNCTICSLEFCDDYTLGTHWINSHNKEALWLFRGYACAICLDSFTNRKVLETHVQERHHAQFVEHCMLIQCIPCGSHFGNSEELWSHVLSVHADSFRQPEIGFNHMTSEASQEKPVFMKPHSIENNAEQHSRDKKFICKFCGLKFDLLPDLGRHHQAAHMGPSSLSSRRKKNGLRFYTYKLKSGRLSRPRLNKGLGAPSYRLRNPGDIMLKKRLQPASSRVNGPINNMKSLVMDASNLARLTEAQCSAVAKLLCSEAHKTKARLKNHEILSTARSACCKVDLRRSLEQKYGALPERLFLKAARLYCEHDIQVNWNQEGLNCSRGCKPQEDENFLADLTCSTRKCERMYSSSSIPNQWNECEMDECHYVIDSRHFRSKHLGTTIILCEDISFGQEIVPVPCVVDKHLIDSLHTPTYSFDGKVVFLPWEGFTYVTKPLLDLFRDISLENLQLGCSCSQSACSPKTCDHVYLFNSDYENAKDINGESMEGRFPYDDKGQLILADNYPVYECNHLCKCEKSCSNRVLQNGIRLKLEVFKTAEKGWAVRAREKILHGTFVCEFIGEVLGMEETNRRRKGYGKDNRDYIYDIGAYIKNMSMSMDEQAEYFIDATRYGNVSRFINHSCSPNLAAHLVFVESMDFPLAHVGLYAKQDIEASEEMSFNYRDKLQPQEGRPCLCESAHCQGRVR